MIQRKRPDAWAVHWGKRRLFILEFTRPNDKDALALQDTDSLKTARYIPLRDRLVKGQLLTERLRGSPLQDKNLPA